MKLRLMYGESFVTYCGFDDYVIDLENFPELQGKTGEEIAKWAYENSNKLSVDEDYDDNAPRPGQGSAYEIVPRDPELTSLTESFGYNGMKFNKIKDEKEYMLFIRKEKDEEDETTA